MIRVPAVKLADVAVAAKVSVSTVSRVLNKDAKQRVGESVRKRIFKAAETLGYRPNPIGRGLRTSRTYSLGITMQELENPVFSQIVDGAESAARNRGYSLVISHAHSLADDVSVYERLELTSRVDGLIVSTVEEDKYLRAALARTSLPFVLVNRRIKGIENSVVFDGKAAAEMATDRLIQANHRRIGFLAGRLTGYNGLARLSGYRSALRATGVTYDPSLVVAAGYTAEGGEKGMNWLLDNVKSPPTAIVAATLLSAAGALRALHLRGLDIPVKMSVISIQDAAISQFFYPQLTAVKLPLFEMGRIAADGLINVIEKQGTVVSAILGPSGIVERDTVAVLRCALTSGIQPKSVKK